MTKKFKDIVKQNPEPARGKCGTSPMDPWNAKSGLAEASEQELLHRYLKSRGINPDFIPKDTKIAHSKSSSFLSWRKAHEFDESVEILEATDEADTISEVKQSALDRFRGAAAEREKKHNDIEKQRQEKLHQDPSKVNVPEPKSNDGMSSAIDRLEKHLNKEEAGISKQKETSFHKKLDTLVHKTFGKRKDELKMKEEVEQIDEISKTTLSSYRDKARTSLKTAQTNRDAAEPGKDMSKGFADLHAKSNATAKKRVKGLMGYLQRKQGMKPTSENTLDAKAATEAPVGPGECCTTETSDRKKQMTKSARMIKNLYKKKNMKEETYDWEKDDKAPQKLGKGVKIEIPKKEANFGENKPEARIVMSGGKTMTGEKRDTVEVDPLMAKRNDTPDQFEKPNKK